MFRRSLAVVGALALAIATPTAAFAATPDDDPSSRFQKSESEGAVDTTATPLSVGADGEVTVIVEMKGDPVAVVQAKKGRDLTQDERNSVKGNLKKAQDAIADAIKGQGGKIQADMQSAYNGIQATIPAEHVDEVAALPNVVAVHAVKTYTVDNAVSVPFLGVPQVWQNTGYTGTNVKVAVIDTGIDYTHANFGGPGTVDAYKAALATDAQAPDPALFGPAAPRVKGGYDFVGDAYNANTPGSVPKPDENPLDCAGHGSHVAGTAAGSGVTDAGATYTGPYDSSTASKAWIIGPGVAPQADIYALRVFGCAGSTNVITPAIDWAVDHGMNVINMSLGSPFSRGDDPDEVAASNAIGAGIVVVKSAGNSGPSPYIAGNGDGVISVSAVDSTATFPGAIVTVGGVGVPAINANGADLSKIGDTTVVRLDEQPGHGRERSPRLLGGRVPVRRRRARRAPARRRAARDMRPGRKGDLRRAGRRCGVADGQQRRRLPALRRCDHLEPRHRSAVHRDDPVPRGQVHGRREVRDRSAGDGGGGAAREPGLPRVRLVHLERTARR